MAINRAVITVTVDVSDPTSSSYEADLAAAWEAAVPSGNYTAVGIFKKPAPGTRESYVMFLEEEV